MNASETQPARAGHALDNAVWHALRGPQSVFAQTDSSGAALRYDPEVAVFGAVDSVDAGSWSAQRQLAGATGFATLFRDEVPPAPRGWTELLREPTWQMCAGDLPAAPPLDVVELSAADADDMLALAELTEPGPFFRRTFEMGRYLGVRRAGRLVAMAGERIRLPGWTEISAVCTHPDVRRAGLGAALTLQVAESIRRRGDDAFLHVLVKNESAFRLYRRLGFEVRRRVEVVMVTWPAA